MNSWARHARPLAAGALLLCLGLAFPAPAGAEEGLWDIYLLARERDPQIRGAMATRDAALEAKPKARSLLLATVVATSGYGLNHFEDLQPRTDPKTGLATATQDYDSKKAGVTLTQPVVNLAYWAGLFLANQKVEEAQAVFQGEKDDLLYRVADRYFKVLAQEEGLAAARAEKLVLETNLARVSRSVELGMLAPALELRARASLDLALAEEIAGANRLANSLDELSELTGSRHQALAGLPDDLPLHTPEPSLPGQWMKVALDSNPLLKSRQHASEAAAMEVNRQLAGYLPSLNLTASHMYGDVGGGRVPGEDNTSTVMLELRVPIFEGGATAAQVREARALLRKAREDYEQTRRSLEREVQVSFRGVMESKRRVEALRRAIASNLAAVESAQDELMVGVSTMSEFLESVRDLFKARRDLAQAKNEYLLHQLRLRQMAGILEEADLRKLDLLLQPGDRLQPLLKAALRPVAYQEKTHP